MPETPLKFIGVRACAGGYQSCINVRQRLYAGLVHTDASDAARDADKVRYWFTRAGLLRNRITPNFPELWESWAASPDDAPQPDKSALDFINATPMLTAPRGRLSGLPSKPVEEPVISTIRRELQRLIDEKPSRLTVEQAATVESTRAILHALLA